MGMCFGDQASELIQEPSTGLKFDPVSADGDLKRKIQQKESDTPQTGSHIAKHCMASVLSSNFCV